MQNPVIFVQMWLGACEECHLSCTESTRSVLSLWVSLLLSLSVFYLSVQKSDNARCLSGVPRLTVEQIRLWKRERQRAEELGESGVHWCNKTLRDEAGWLILVFIFEKSPFECLIRLSLICHPLRIIFLQRRSCVFRWVHKWQAELFIRAIICMY